MPRNPKPRTSEPDVAGLRRHAVSLLARRDHARAELRQKLARKFGAAPDLDPVLDWCEEHDFLNDRRFAGVFVRSRIDRGQGPLRIRAELQQRGLAGPLIEEALGDADCDWFSLARDVRRRRFPVPAVDRREKAKQLRFLQSRGFNAEQSFHALDHDGDED